MTDKQIIIDGVNVLNCGHYSQFEGETENACYIMQKTFIGKEEISKEYCSCETNPNCYYKQLKRKEQECEWWKRQAELGSDTTDRLAKQLEEKEQELDECREKLHKQLDLLKAELEKEKALKQTYLSCYKTKHGDAKGKLFKYERYRQALEEIREMCKQKLPAGLSASSCYESFEAFTGYIQQKCEVIKNEEN